MDQVHFGVDYYPEHWPPELLDEDIARIAGLGSTMVRIGEFAWHLMEPREGEFDFSFFDGVIERVSEAGMVVLFGTPTATFPAWLARAHPDILSQDEWGRPRAFGGRRQYCFNSATYRRYAATITAEVVSHFADNPAVVAWQIDNEIGHEGSDDCYCPHCRTRWTQWLTAKYRDVDELNRRYGTIFWGQTYNDFDEVPPPLPTITSHNPSLRLDWMRFRSDSLNEFTDEMIAVTRRHRRADQTITHNLPGGLFDKLWRHAENVRDLDVVSYDNYPVWGGLKEPMPPAQIAMTLDFVRGLRRQNFWIVEQLMGAQGHEVIGYLPRPGQAKMWAYQAFGHGCDTMLWFRDRGMDRGAEQFCYGILEHDNRAGRRYQEVQSAVSDLSQYQDSWRSPVAAAVAVLYDMDNVWSWRIQQQSVGFDFTTEFMRLYEPFHRLNAAIDVLPVGADLSRYRVIALPVPQIVDQDLVAQLEQFVAAGGTLLLSFRAGLKNRDNNVNFGQVLPGPLGPLAGIEVAEVEALQEPVMVAGELGSGTGDVWRDLIEPLSAQVLLNYTDPPYSQRAALTRNEFGAGSVYYMGTGLDVDLVRRLGHQIASEAGVESLETPEGLEVCRRGAHAVLANHTAEPVRFAGEDLGPYGCAVIPGERVQWS